MNKKKYYSLTANQRKALRADEQAKINKKLGLTAPKTEEGSQEAVAKKPNRLWVLITAIIIGVLLIVTAIILPIVLLSNNSKYPLATIYLNDGRKINLAIWEETCPIAATNFIYLANSGFFDGTLLYDVQNNFARFGAMTNYKEPLKYKDDNFINSLNNFGLEEVPTNYKDNARKNRLGYKLKADNSTDKNRSSERGVISYISNNTADFVINIAKADELNNSTFESKNSFSTSSENFRNYVRPFGQVDEDSLKILESIYALEKDDNPGVNYYVATKPQIRISKIRVTNLNEKDKWNKNFVFVKYMNTALNNDSAWSGWYAN